MCISKIVKNKPKNQKNDIDLEILKRIVEDSLRDFLKYDAKELLDIDAYEITISGKIAMYIHKRLVENNSIPDCIHVDSEYNKQYDPKTHMNERKSPPIDYSNDSIRPDIIIHQRKTTDNNLVYCEVKKGKPDDDDKTKVKHALNSKLNYRLGLLIFNIEKNTVTIRWASNEAGVEDKNNNKSITLQE